MPVNVAQLRDTFEERKYPFNRTEQNRFEAYSLYARLRWDENEANKNILI